MANSARSWGIKSGIWLLSSMGERKLNFKKVCKVDQIVERIKGWIQDASSVVSELDEVIEMYGERNCDDWTVNTRNEMNARIEALEDVLNLFKEQGYDGE
jgi:hypothetical protein